jgi:hypothetical protein
MSPLAFIEASLTSWHSAVVLYFGIMTYIVLAVLNEVRPMWYYVLSAVFFVLGQLAYFLLGKIICKVPPLSALSVSGLNLRFITGFKGKGRWLVYRYASGDSLSDRTLSSLEKHHRRLDTPCPPPQLSVSHP